MTSEGNGDWAFSQLEAWMPKGQSYPAGLYIVATPIGNLADISLRALWVLQLADVILCEDTRVTRKLLSHYGITGKLVAYHEHNATDIHPRVLEHLTAEKRVALVSDAGTPLISDPGYRLVREVQMAGHYVSSLPGASSVPLALTLAGQPTDRFLFTGFLPSKAHARRKAIAELADLPFTLVLLEAPHRLVNTLQDLAEGLGATREASVLRELTKRHEEVRRDSLSELAAYYAKQGAPKGEIVLVIGPSVQNEQSLTAEEIDAQLHTLLKTHSVKEAASELVKTTGLPRKTLYNRALEIKNDG